MLLLTTAVLSVAMGLHPFLDDLIVEVRHPRTLNLLHLLELFSNELKLQLRKVFMKILRDTSSRLIDDRVPVRPIEVFGIGKL